MSRDETPGKSRASRPARASASSFRTSRLPASSAKIARRPGAGRGLEHEIGRSDRGGRGGSEAKLDRRRELLQRLALLGAARMRRQQRRDLAQHAQTRRRRARRGRACRARTCAGTGQSRPRRRRRRSSSPRRRRHRSRRRRASSPRAARRRRCAGRARDEAEERRAAAMRPAETSDFGASEGEQRRVAQPLETERSSWRRPQESGNGSNRRGALSGPDRLKPVPAVLFLSFRGRHPAHCS